MAVTVETLTGDAIVAVLADVARLRIAVFREWLYLYDGTVEHERGYLADFAAEPEAVAIAVRDGATIVGATTAAPLSGHSQQFMPLFSSRGLDPERVFYLG